MGFGKRKKSTTKTRIGEVGLNENDVIHYPFDFGDDWWHRIRVQKIYETKSKKKHIKSPLITKLTNYFQKRIEEWGDSFYLPDLSRLSENEYKDMFGHLKTGISYDLFHRNVTIAVERAEKLAEKNQ